MQKLISNSFLIFTALILALAAGCSGSGKPDEGTNTGNNPAPTSMTSNQSGSVVNRVEQAGPLSYKIYLQPESNATNRKGLVLLGSGNNESSPTTGSLDGALENNTANELAKLGYVAAIVAYRAGLPVDFANDKNASDKWNTNSENLGNDMSNVADSIIKTYGGGLSQNRVVLGGASYTSYMLLTNIAFPNTPLANMRGVLAACGATGKFDAENFKLPIFSLNCQNSADGDSKNTFYGKPLIDFITNQTIKDQSDFFTDPACNSHCGGDTNTWTDKLVKQVQTWLP